MIKDSNGNYPYKNIFDCINKSVQKEGVSNLWVGFPTYYFRIAPHVMLTWISIGVLNDIWHKSNK